MPFASVSHASRPLLQRAAGLGVICLMVASMAACGSTKRGGPESAPPPMKPIDPAAVSSSRAPAQASAPAPVASAPAAPAPGPVSPVAEMQEPGPGPIAVKAGLHRCELDRRILVKRVTTDGNAVQVNWNGKDYSMLAVTTKSGARRFEDSKAGIAWVVISVKAFLLDTKRGQILANECKL